MIEKKRVLTGFDFGDGVKAVLMKDLAVRLNDDGAEWPMEARGSALLVTVPEIPGLPKVFSFPISAFRSDH